MGLDPSYFSNLVKVKTRYDRHGDPIIPKSCTLVRLDENSRHDGFVENDGMYQYETSGSFNAGSYSGYNAWRNTLAKLAGFESAEDAWNKDGGPFWELINFSDCEGVIGPETSKKLAKDFAEFEDRAKDFIPPVMYDYGHFFKKYLEWKQAFEVASDNGIVKFT